MNAKRISLLVVFLAALASLSGYLMSKASFIGRLGMTFVYKEYRFLKTWWKGERREEFFSVLNTSAGNNFSIALPKRYSL